MAPSRGGLLRIGGGVAAALLLYLLWALLRPEDL
ncbi:potassium-transporting ATPase subunit F [Roseicella sp. DB1501]|nr:potassium-transporting ATPase subunit F [Roseicella sp. DB1501]NOG69742.1 potassium-transporting ATPase subunit F [Roseicella sp. DB1501]